MDRYNIAAANIFSPNGILVSRSFSFLHSLLKKLQGIHEELPAIFASRDGPWEKVRLSSPAQLQAKHVRGGCQDLNPISTVDIKTPA